MRVRIVLSTFVVLWLLIGLVASFQRGLFSPEEASCSNLGHTVGTIFVGPLNYMGVNPTIECPALPEPSE
ncbi:hypothetical protein Q8791_23805 [Nocardiopsis sp. CT-R113]|uniref:Secreted protein n=1 Tax=Nocardiopsis codii TaxID=3065942 RepID=A0ABU7KDE1_9ACTN|nr:hypothetical protein [Nocardiopsis sp. CT-R113]MEE2040246.1 hypothetical protein [Nocardiopsis sp. CT-R113]